MSVVEDPFVGQKMGNVLLLEKIGQGGFGAVYRGKHVFVEKPFAVKILKFDQLENEEVVARFQREAKALAQLKHDNIVQFHDFGELDNHGFYLVMEQLDGENLHEQLRSYFHEQKLHSVDEIKILMKQLCEALSYIHHKGIVHRDLKPTNIFLHQTEEGELCIKLLDFGIVSLTQEASDLTGVGEYLGSASYVSPEQAKGEGNIDARADLYSTGVILFRLLTGRLPLKGNNHLETVLKHINQAPPNLAQMAPQKEWSNEIEEFIQIILAKQRSERPGDAKIFWEMCERALNAQLAFEQGGTASSEEQWDEADTVMFSVADRADFAQVLEKHSSGDRFEKTDAEVPAPSADALSGSSEKTDAEVELKGLEGGGLMLSSDMASLLDEAVASVDAPEEKQKPSSPPEPPSAPLQPQTPLKQKSNPKLQIENSSFARTPSHQMVRAIKRSPQRNMVKGVKPIASAGQGASASARPAPTPTPSGSFSPPGSFSSSSNVYGSGSSDRISLSGSHPAARGNHSEPTMLPSNALPTTPSPKSRANRGTRNSSPAPKQQGSKTGLIVVIVVLLLMIGLLAGILVMRG